MKHLLAISFCVFHPFNSFVNAQEHSSPDINLLQQVIVDGDTLLVTALEEIYVFPQRKFRSRGDMRRYARLVRNVKAAYPYAKLAKEKYEEVMAYMHTLKSEKAKKAYLAQVEKEIKLEFEAELKNLTITQGRILIKLIDREIGETSYDLVKDLRGTFNAIFWQTFARIFGSNLRSKFDADGEDKLINEIVIMIEQGLL